MKISDIVIYPLGEEIKGPRCEKNEEKGYNLAWHRHGLHVIECPEGCRIVKNEEVPQDVCPISKGDIVDWGRFEDWCCYEIVNSDGNDVCVFRYFMREIKTWKYKCTLYHANINDEVMLQLSDIYEDQWSSTTSSHISSGELIPIIEELRNILPQGVDDALRDKILGLWYRRLVQSLVQDLQSHDKGIVDAATVQMKGLFLCARN